MKQDTKYYTEKPNEKTICDVSLRLVNKPISTFAK
jgi:hypothetical protein